MNIAFDGAEIDDARDPEVYGEWVKFIDGEGASVKITPSVLSRLFSFAVARAIEFEDGAWE